MTGTVQGTIPYRSRLYADNIPVCYYGQPPAHLGKEYQQEVSPVFSMG